MSDMYNRIAALCEERGIKPGRMCAEIGLSSGQLTDLKMGRTKYLSVKNAARVAEYFGVSVEYLMGQTDQREPAEAPSAGALVNGDPELTEYLEMLKSRPECRMLFSLTRDATKADVEQAVAIIEALRRTRE